MEATEDVLALRKMNGDFPGRFRWTRGGFPVRRRGMSIAPLLRCVGPALVFAGWAGGVACAAPVRYQAAVFEQVEVKADVVFAKTAGLEGEPTELHLDVYAPVGDTEPARPAIVWLHGGGMRAGVDRKQDYVVTLATEFAKRGYVSFSVDYTVASGRVRGVNPLPSAVADVQAALDWIRVHAAEYRVDPARLAIGGGSAGGFVGANAAAKPGRTPGVKPLFAFIDLWGSPAGPLQIVPPDAAYPPTLILHGTADKKVPFAFSEKFAARLKELGVKCILVPLPGAGHTPVDRMPVIMDQTARFLFDALNATRPSAGGKS